MPVDPLYEVNQMMNFCSEIIGKEGPITLKSCICSHGRYVLDDLNIAYSEDDEYYVIGKEGQSITFQDITDTFDKINNNETVKNLFNCNQTYIFEGFKKKDDRTYEIKWGS